MNLYMSSVLVSRTMNTPPLMTSWVRECCLLFSSPAHCKCNHQCLSHSAALCFSCHSQRCFCHPSDPWQSVSCSWMCCCNKHSILWPLFCAELMVFGRETEAQGSRFIVPVVRSGSSDRGPGGLGLLQSCGPCRAVSGAVPSPLCPVSLLTFPVPHRHVLSTPASSASCPQD